MFYISPSFRSGITAHIETTNTIMLLTSGGVDVLLDFGGQDATAAFEDVGHSPQAREYLDGLLIGELEKQVW
jgi:hypothetical protein